MTRIVLLLDSLTVPAWVYQSISLVMAEKDASIVLAVINSQPRASGKKSPFLYRLYRALDRRLFLQTPDAFASKKLSDIPGWNIPTLLVKPNQGKFTDEFADEDLKQIRDYRPDLIIRFGFRILKGNILTLAPLGVWSYHHGDPSVYRGGPPAFWEVIKQLPVTGMALLRLTEKLDEGPILYQSWTQTDPLSVQRNANRIFWQSSFFVARVLKRLAGGESIDSIFPPKENQPQSPLWKPPGNVLTVSLVGSLFFRNAIRKAKEFIYKPHWQIGWVAEKELSASQKPEKLNVTWLHPSQKDWYWADPFCLTVHGEEFVFVEGFDKKKKKGVIECILPDGSSIQVLEEPWHLSYPFIWEENGEIFMIPESAEAGKIYWYRAVNFPEKWERIGVLFDQTAYDPTLWQDESGYWLFVNQQAHPACSPFDELFLYHSESLTEPRWKAHPLNPIVSDVRRSRPAGRLFVKDGKLYRPGQDSGLRYGYGVKLHEVLQLSLTDYEERPVFHLSPQAEDPFLGIHTFNQAGERVYLDFYSRK
jgi:folate-dependent phosphoribosylglycinamide formyltransferase PurN